MSSLAGLEQELAGFVAAFGQAGMPGCPIGTLATGLLASIEGGMVLSQARKDMTSLRVAVEAGLAHVRAYAS